MFLQIIYSQYMNMIWHRITHNGVYAIKNKKKSNQTYTHIPTQRIRIHRLDPLQSGTTKRFFFTLKLPSDEATILELRRVRCYLIFPITSNSTLNRIVWYLFRIYFSLCELTTTPITAQPLSSVADSLFMPCFCCYLVHIWNIMIQTIFISSAFLQMKE